MFLYPPNLFGSMLGFDHNWLAGRTGLDPKTARKLVEFLPTDSPRPRKSTLVHVYRQMCGEEAAGWVERKAEESERIPLSDLRPWGFLVSEILPRIGGDLSIAENYILRTYVFFEGWTFTALAELWQRKDCDIWMQSLLAPSSPLVFAEKNNLREAVDQAIKGNPKQLSKLFLSESLSIHVAAVEIHVEDSDLDPQSHLKARRLLPTWSGGRLRSSYWGYFQWLKTATGSASLRELADRVGMEYDQIRRWSSPSGPRHYIGNGHFDLLISKIGNWMPEVCVAAFWWLAAARLHQRHVDEMNRSGFSYSPENWRPGHINAEVDAWKKRLREVVPQSLGS